MRGRGNPAYSLLVCGTLRRYDNGAYSSAVRPVGMPRVKTCGFVPRNMRQVVERYRKVPWSSSGVASPLDDTPTTPLLPRVVTRRPSVSLGATATGRGAVSVHVYRPFGGVVSRSERRARDKPSPLGDGKVTHPPTMGCSHNASRSTRKRVDTPHAFQRVRVTGGPLTRGRFQGRPASMPGRT